MKIFSILAFLLLTSCQTALRHEAELKVMANEAADESIDDSLDKTKSKESKKQQQPFVK